MQLNSANSAGLKWLLITTSALEAAWRVVAVFPLFANPLAAGAVISLTWRLVIGVSLLTGAVPSARFPGRTAANAAGVAAILSGAAIAFGLLPGTALGLWPKLLSAATWLAFWFALSWGSRNASAPKVTFALSLSFLLLEGALLTGLPFGLLAAAGLTSVMLGFWVSALVALAESAFWVYVGVSGIRDSRESELGGLVATSS